MKKIIIIMTVFVTSYCSQSKDKNYYDLYKERILLESLTAPVPDPLSACKNSYKSMEECLRLTTTAMEIPGGLNEFSLTAILSDNQYYTYEEQCNSYLNSESQKKFSDSAKECIQNCQKKYWDTRLKENKCTEDFTLQIQGASDGTNTCIRTCFQLTNIEVKF